LRERPARDTKNGIMERVPYEGLTLTRWNVGPSTFLALPERGARLMNWHVTHGDGSVRDVVYWPENAGPTEEFFKVRGGNPILFPFNARTFDRGDIHFWRDPAGERRPMPMHGIARQGNFEVSRLDERGFAATFRPDDEARAAYPYDYEFTVIYRFAPLGLSCEFVLANLDTRPIPWSAGHHFYFTVPWDNGRSRAEYAIRIPSTRTLRQTPTGGLVPGPTLAPEGPLDRPDLVDTFHLGLKHNTVVFGPAGAPGEVAVRLGAEKVPPPEATFVTWTLQDDSPFYCVEPWMGPANAPETGVGLHWVQPGQTQSFVVEVAVK
jgi:galactose mutarotase-like enzyme